MVQIGSNPDCDTWTSHPVADCATQSFAPDFLQPGATYYWRLRWGNVWCGGYIDSPAQSFTTTGPLATHATTWGRVKAMYRD